MGKPSMPEECLRLLHEMEDHGIKPNTITFSSLITAFANASPSRPEDAEAILERMSDATVDANTIPGRPDKAEEVLHRMAEKGVHADTISYNTVIKAYSNTGKPSFFEAMKVHDLMTQNGVFPNIITWNSLLHAANHDRRPGVLEAANKLYKFPYPAMLHILANWKREVEARSVFEEAQSNLPQWPNEFVFKAALRACPSQKTELHALWNQAARQPREVYSGEANRRIALAYRRQKGMQ